MKSVGEIMSIGRTFQESFQKGIQSLEESLSGFESIIDEFSDQNETLQYELTFAGSNRYLFIADALRLGWTVEHIHSLTGIDPWFLEQIRELIDLEMTLSDKTLSSLDAKELLFYKKKGFSDKRLAFLMRSSEDKVRGLRVSAGIIPSFKRVDTCAGEFATETAYMYSTYDGNCEANPSNQKKVIVLGSGPNRIGQGIEFDYCCVHASQAIQDAGFESIMINCNPETVSTDYDTSNRLYFEPITEEKVLDIIEIEKPFGVIIQFGGQTPLKLADSLAKHNINILGTSIDAIDISEDRRRFQELIQKLKLNQPMNMTVLNEDEALAASDQIGFPMVVRPSYVLGGRAMELVHNSNELKKYLHEAVEISDDKPILLDRYLDNAVELDVDVISDGQNVRIGGVLQHIEQAGIHSGDSACSLPPYDLSKKLVSEIIDQATKLAKELKIIGLMNVQFAIKDEKIFIIEVNPRASRTVPFISKALGQSLVKDATLAMLGDCVKDKNYFANLSPNFFYVKEAVMPFDKFPLVDPILGPEMKSTGEVMGIGSTFGEAYSKAQLSAKKPLRSGGRAFISVKDNDKKYLEKLLPELNRCNFSFVATRGTAEVINEHGYKVDIINKVNEGRPHIVDELVNQKVDLVINTTEGHQSITDSASIRKTALQNKIFCTTTIFGAFALIQAFSVDKSDWNYDAIQDIT